MKKTKLALRTEVLRPLARPLLDQVVGGLAGNTSTLAPTQIKTCMCTITCDLC